MADNFNKSTYTPDEKIADRNNWLRIAITVCVVVVLLYKLIELDLKNVLLNFNFSDLLTLFLALFSVALSVVFYFKATDTANEFYNNTYKFTKEVSEILGRVESGFGEKLAHLDKGYTGLKSVVERLPYDSREAEAKIEKEEAEVSEAEKARDVILNTLAERAKLDNEEKSSLFSQLKEQEEKLNNAHMEIAQMRNRLVHAEMQDHINIRNPISPNLMKYLKNYIWENCSREIKNNLGASSVIKRFEKSIKSEDAPIGFAEDLINHKILDEDKDVTPYGFRVIQRNILKE